MHANNSISHLGPWPTQHGGCYHGSRDSLRVGTHHRYIWRECGRSSRDVGRLHGSHGKYLVRVSLFELFRGNCDDLSASFKDGRRWHVQRDGLSMQLAFLAHVKCILGTFKGLSTHDDGIVTLRRRETVAEANARFGSG
jgi:hypothetical protein